MTVYNIGCNNCPAMQKDGRHTKGHHLLDRRLLTESELARRAGVSPQAINRVRHGGRPGRALARKLKELLGIPEDAWLTAVELTAIKRVRRAASI